LGGIVPGRRRQSKYNTFYCFVKKKKKTPPQNTQKTETNTTTNKRKKTTRGRNVKYDEKRANNG